MGTFEKIALGKSIMSCFGPAKFEISGSVYTGVQTCLE